MLSTRTPYTFSPSVQRIKQIFVVVVFGGVFHWKDAREYRPKNLESRLQCMDFLSILIFFPNIIPTKTSNWFIISEWGKILPICDFVLVCVIMHRNVIRYYIHSQKILSLDSWLTNMQYHVSILKKANPVPNAICRMILRIGSCCRATFQIGSCCSLCSLVYHNMGICETNFNSFLISFNKQVLLIQ